jgi:hypothetical protein
MADDGRIRILHEVALREPTLIAAWPGMGLVGFNAVEFLRTHLAAQKIAEIDPADFFSVAGIQVKEGLAAPLRIPSNTFHAWFNPAGPHDLLLFLGSSQPAPGREIALSSLVLDVAERFHAKRLVTAAAMASQIDHLAPSKVFGVCNHPDEVTELKKLGVQLLQEGEVGGLNGLLIGVAQERGFHGSCLMGEMPHYTTHIENPKASQAVLEILCRMLSLELDFTPLVEKARFLEAQIQGFLQAARARGEQGESGAETSEAEESSPTEEEEEPGTDSGAGPRGGGKPAIN